MTFHVTTRPAVLLSGLLIATLAAGAVGVAGVDGQDSAAVGYEGDTYRETAIGDPIREPYHIILTDTRNATIVFTGARNTETAFWANLTLHDGDGDGHIFLYINMWEIGHTNPFRAESGSVARFDQDALADNLLLNKTKSTDQSAYELYLGTGTDPAAVLASHAATARLRVEEAETEDMNVMTAPRGATIEAAGYVFNGTGAFSPVYHNMSVRDDTVMAAGDTLVYAPFGGGYYGVAEHALRRTGSREAAFEWMLTNGYLEFSVTETGEDPKVLNITQAIDVGALQFDSGLHYYHLIIAIDTRAAVFQRNGEGEFLTAQAGETYQASIAKTGRVDPSGDPAFLRTKRLNVSIVTPTAEFDAPVNTLEENRIAGRTSLAPGSEVTVYVDTGAAVVELTTRVDQAWQLDQYQSGQLLHRFNVSTELGDVDTSKVQVEAWSADGTRLGSFPPGVSIRTTTGGDGDDSDGKTTGTSLTEDDEGPATDTPRDADTTTGPSDRGSDGGDGGLIPGFTIVTGVLGIVLALIALANRQ